MKAEGYGMSTSSRVPRRTAVGVDEVRKQSTVVVMVPCRNERAYIEQCIRSICAQDYPAELVTIVIADGMSDDGTRRILDRMAADNARLHVLDNPAKYVPAGLNAVIRMFDADLYIRMDAHCVYPSDYISRCVVAMQENDAWNVGGVLNIEPGAPTWGARSIAAAVSSTFGIGNALYRLQTQRVVPVDTVPFGCFRKDVFVRVGLFDEKFIRNQDDEFNLRITRAGGRIVLDPRIRCTYYARRTFRALWRQYFRYGWWKYRVLEKHHRLAAVRNAVPIGFALFVLVTGPLLVCGGWLATVTAGVWLVYLVLSLVFAWCSVRRQKRGSVIGVMWAYFILHFSYGLGFWAGLLAHLFKGERR